MYINLLNIHVKIICITTMNKSYFMKNQTYIRSNMSEYMSACIRDYIVFNFLSDL